MVSTIIPTYNSAAYLREAVESALSQTCQDQEIIVVDDGSTDATGKILASFGDRIRSVRQANGGQVAARNHGASLATGEWLAFLDSDDQWLPEKLQRQIAAAGNAAIVYTPRFNFGAVDRFASQVSDPIEDYDGDVFERLLETNFITLSSVIMRRDWFNRLGGFSEPRGCEDWDLWLRCTSAGGRVAVVADPLTRYRWHSASTSQNEELMCRGRIEVVERALSTPRGRQLAREQVNRARAGAWRCSAWHASDTQIWTPLIWYLRAAWYRPTNFSIYKSMAKCLLRRQ